MHEVLSLFGSRVVYTKVFRVRASSHFLHSLFQSTLDAVDFLQLVSEISDLVLNLSLFYFYHSVSIGLLELLQLIFVPRNTLNKF
jgi:hypothetical protein